MSNNPLAGYFRMPGIHIALPTGGAFTPSEDIELDMDGQLAVFPMTAKDEVWSKNPDALLNGRAIEEILISCVPGVKNPRALPSIDVDVLLLGIKKATYGDAMGITAKCPKCKKEHGFEASIDTIIAGVRPTESEYPVRINDEVIAKLRPYSYFATTKTNIAAFEETKMFQAIINADGSEEARVRAFSDSFNKISTMNLDMLVDCIVEIVVPNAVVTDRKFIAEYIRNAPKQAVAAIQTGMQVFMDKGVDRKIELVCPEETCHHSWQTELTFDPSHFFA